MTSVSKVDKVIDLSPPGGTPFFKWFSCCMPKSQPQKSVVQRTSKSVETSQDVHIPSTEEVQEKAEEATFFDLPTLDESESEDDFVQPQKPSNIIADFWTMIWTFLILNWLRQSRKRKAITNGSEKDVQNAL